MPFGAYFDASGKDEDPVLTVGGYIATDAASESIESLWDEATDGKTFHLADFGRPQCKLGSGDWSTPRRISFIKRLSAIVTTRQSIVVSVSVMTDVYQSFRESASHPYMFGPPFSGCAQMCFGIVEHVLQASGLAGEKIAYVFELGDRQHEISKTFYEFAKSDHRFKGLRSLAFLPKTRTLLQPADLIAGKIQEVLKVAHSAGGLDSAEKLVCLQRLSPYFMNDGTSSALLAGTIRKPRAYLVNRNLFSDVDSTFADMFEHSPMLHKKAMKNRVPKKSGGAINEQ